MNILNKLERNNFTNNTLTKESWDAIIVLLTNSVNQNKGEWEKFFFSKLKTFLCYKYFTKKKQYLKGIDAENELKLLLKNYYTSLVSTADTKEFLERVHRLPNKVLFYLLRYCFDKSAILKKAITVSRNELTDEIKKIKKKRKLLAVEINNVSLHYENVLNFTMLFDVYNNGAFFENNFINQGITEFLYKLVDNEFSFKHLVDRGVVSKAELIEVKKSLLTFPSYNAYLKLKKEKECFTSEGEQVGRRFSNYIDLLNEPFQSEEYVIDLDSIYKEPYKAIHDEEEEEEEEETTDSEKAKKNTTSSKNVGANTGGKNFNNTAEIKQPEIDAPQPDTLPAEFGDNV